MARSPSRLGSLPAVKLAHRIRIAYVLFLLPLLYLVVALAGDALDGIRIGERELAGARYAAALRSLQDEAQRRRSEGMSLSPDDLASRIVIIEKTLDTGLSMASAVETARLSLSSLAPLPEDEAHQILHELIVTLVDRSSLSFDAHPDSYYLTEALLVKLPELIDHLGRVAQLARGLASPADAPPRLRDALDRQRSAIYLLADSIDRTLDAAALANMVTATPNPLISALGGATNATRALADALADIPASARSHLDLAGDARQAFDALARLRIDGGAALQSLLAARVADDWRVLKLRAAATMLLFTIGAVFLFVAVERGMLQPIHRITELMRRLASGDTATAFPPVRRRDEIGAMFQALTVFKDDAVRRIEQERALRLRQDVLVGLTQHRLVGRTPLAATLDAITRTASEMLDADRASVVIARLTGTPVVASRWHAETQAHDHDDHLYLTPDGMAFQRLAASLTTPLEAKLVVAIEQVADDVRLPADVRAWLVGRNVQSLIIAQATIPGRAPGYLTLASVGRMRQWTERDLAFVRSLAGLAAFAILDHGHHQALTALDLVDEGLHVADASGEIVYANRMSRSFAGVGSSGAVAAERLPAPALGQTDAERVWHDHDGVARDLEIVRRSMPDGNLVTVLRDVSARKRQERAHAALEAELRQAAKMEAIGRLAGGIAHDFNNALGTMIGYIGFLLEDLPPGGRDHEHAGRLMRAADHAKKIVRQILTYSRAEASERRVVDLRSVLAETSTLVQVSLPITTGIDVAPASDPLPVRVNESEIHQILLNLCINAHDAMEGMPGRIAISLGRGAAAPGAMAPPQGAPPARVTGGRLDPGRPYACLTVADSGTGMDQLTLSRIFEPFFTTKERGRGTGLGLAVVHGIVMAHDGAYVVESRRGQGTRFSIYLPLEAGLPVPGATDPAADPAPRGTESVLVIDDDADLLEMTAAALERFGYDVTSSNDPVEALAAIAVDPGAWDVVVSDQVMPGLSGLDLLAKIKRIRPDCPVILCTGFTDDMSEARARALGADGFFWKPVEPAVIARRIRALFDRAPGTPADARPREAGGRDGDGYLVGGL
jgi:signal transduction histidine kinase/ActR/RegA family two-component response regulator/HAMP domain-containing protein